MANGCGFQAPMALCSSRIRIPRMPICLHQNPERMYTAGQLPTNPCAPSTDDVQITFSTGCSARLASTGDARKQSALSESSELSSEAVQVYPVPASESITVEIPFEGTWKAELRNMNGALVKTMTSNERTSTLEVSEIPAGLYVLYIQGNSRRFIKKVEVVR